GVEGRAVERRDDRGHARVAPEGRESRVEGRAELGACRGQRVAREEEREGGRASARKLALDQSRSATRLGRLDEAAGLELAALNDYEDRRKEQVAGDREDRPALPGAEPCPGRRHGRPALR